MHRPQTGLRAVLSRWWPAIGVALAVFISRVVAIAVTHSYRHPQLFESEDIANNLLAGRGFTYSNMGVTYRSFNQPLCGMMQAAVYALTNHSHLAMLLLQALFSSLLCMTIWAIAIRLTTPRAALISAVLVGFHPGLAYYDVFQIVPLSFDAWCFALIILQFLRCWENPTASRLFTAGLYLGISALSRGTGLLFVAPGVLWLAWVQRFPWQKVLRQGVFVLAGMLLLVGPWVARNCWVHRRFTPWINTSTGELLWRGNNSNASGGAYTASGQSIFETAPPEFVAEIYSLDELGQKAAFEREAVRFIRENPGRFVRLTFQKFLQFWGSSPQRGIRYPRIYLRLYTIYYLVIVAVGLAGLWGLIRRPPTPWCRRGLALLVLFALTVSATHSLFYVDGRHRWTVEPFLLILTAAGLSLMVKVRSVLQ